MDKCLHIEQTDLYFCFQATGMTPLMYAVKDNRTSLLDKLIDLGSDVGARNNVSCQNSNRFGYARNT